MASDFARGPSRTKSRSRRSAELTFDSVNKQGKNSLLLSWLNFRLERSVNASRRLSSSILSGQRPALQHRAEPSKRTDCYEYPKDDLQGKVALLCDAGLGFSVHAAYQLPSMEVGLDQWVRGAYIASRQLRTWHPRLGGSRGQCEFGLT
jgi:hypothetical protein